MQSLVNQFKKEIVPHVKTNESKALLDQLEQCNDVELILKIMSQFKEEKANWLIREYTYFIKRLYEDLHRLDVLNVDEMENRILDFDLSGFEEFSNEQYVRFHAIRQGPPYMQEAGKSQYSQRIPIPLGQHPWELLYFVLARLFQDQKTPELHRALYQEILKYIPIRVGLWDPSEILQILAKHSLDLESKDETNSVTDAPIKQANNKLASRSPSGLFSEEISSNEQINVDWKAWLTLLETHETSEGLYYAIHASEKHKSEWRNLTMKMGLRFCHPLIPLTEEKREELKPYLEKNRDELILKDRRFKKVDNSETGIIYQAESYNEISDRELKNCGINPDQCVRKIVGSTKVITVYASIKQAKEQINVNEEKRKELKPYLEKNRDELILKDRRFKKVDNSETGIIYQAESGRKISDNELKNCGIDPDQCVREIVGTMNVITVYASIKQANDALTSRDSSGLFSKEISSPLIPLTEEKRNELKLFLEKNLEKNRDEQKPSRTFQNSNQNPKFFKQVESCDSNRIFSIASTKMLDRG